MNQSLFDRVREIVHEYDRVEAEARNLAESALSALGASVVVQPVAVIESPKTQIESVQAEPLPEPAKPSGRTCKVCGDPISAQSKKGFCRVCWRKPKEKGAEVTEPERAEGDEPDYSDTPALAPPSEGETPDYLAGVAVAQRKSAEEREAINAVIHAGLSMYPGVRFDIHQNQSGRPYAVAVHTKVAEGHKPVLRVERHEGRPYAKFFGNN